MTKDLFCNKTQKASYFQVLFSEPTESNRIKHGFAGSEFFQYFYVFSSSVRLDRTHKNHSIKHRNIEKIRFGPIELIRFGSIFQESSRVSLYNIFGLKKN